MITGKRTTAVLGPAGWDRCRVGERLHAALAGLQELHLLREKQQALVAEALATEAAPLSMQHCANAQSKTVSFHSEEYRLEATLTVLKEQLSRLRRQDVGLKSHLDQLDQQISELKLDVSKTSSEHLDSDSRPSSGFYELSDGGSGSLSNSCTSLYSECMSSSRNSLKPCSQQLRNRLSVFDYRPKSADETTVHVSSAATNLQRRGIYTRDVSQIKISSKLAGHPPRPRPRPVSTGDLERLIPSDTGFQTMVNLKSVSSLCYGDDIQLHIVDPKYQNDLVSKRGNDVYPYPSPLHAVALQSPIFALSGESRELANHSLVQNSTPNALTAGLMEGTRLLTELKPGGYINKLLQLSKCKVNNQPKCNDRAPEKILTTKAYQRLALKSSTGGVKINNSNCLKEKQVCTLEVGKQEGIPRNEAHDGDVTKQYGNIYDVHKNQTSSLPVVEGKAVNWFNTIEDTPAESLDHLIKLGSYSTLALEESSQKQSHFQSTGVPSHKSKKISNTRNKSHHGMLGQIQFVEAKFVPAESHQVKLKLSTSKNKVIKMKRRNSEKVLRPSRSIHSIDKTRLNEDSRLPYEWIQHNRHNTTSGKILIRRPTFVGEAAGRACSETNLYPVQLRIPYFMPRPQVYRNSSSALHSLETAMSNKQRKWQSSVEISVKSHRAGFPSGPGSSLVQHRQPVKKAGVMRTVSLSARHHQQVNTYAKSESDHSEYSAECASLFHSTIVETSEEELSDYTTNRFGDSESSESDSDAGTSSSSLTLDLNDTVESELMWPETSVRHPAAAESMNRPLLPEPKICRIKASKALKKKIRRFQPASLKVMTMV
ncbi:hypothetical protein FKM82_010714 [Ascaphus truei]